MRQRPRLSLVGTIALLVIVSAIGFLQQRGNGVWRDDGSKGGDTSANSAGQFDYYALVMSWSPTHCSTPEGEDDAQQCSRRDGRRYAFVLHGLWPQYERGYPESCRTRDRPFVPQPVIDDMLDVMPSKGLIIHQYRKHGTCSGLDPDDYFELARRLFQSIRIPDRFVNPSEAQSLSSEQLVDDLVTSNPQLKPDMVAVACGGPGNRLKEVRICFTRDGKMRSCGANEDERKLCRSDKFSVPPVRSTKRPD
jgi:ribonuclease T2